MAEIARADCRKLSIDCCTVLAVACGDAAAGALLAPDDARPLNHAGVSGRGSDAFPGVGTTHASSIEPAPASRQNIVPADRRWPAKVSRGAIACIANAAGNLTRYGNRIDPALSIWPRLTCA